MNNGARCPLIKMSKTFNEFVDTVGLTTPIQADDLSENGTKTELLLHQLRLEMEKLKRSLKSNLDYEQEEIKKSVKTLWQVNHRKNGKTLLEKKFLYILTPY